MILADPKGWPGQCAVRSNRAAELTKLERVEQIAEWIKITDRIQPPLTAKNERGCEPDLNQAPDGIRAAGATIPTNE